DQDRVEELDVLLGMFREKVPVGIPAGGADVLHALLEAPHEGRPPVAGVVEAALVAHVLEQRFEAGVRFAQLCSLTWRSAPIAARPGGGRGAIPAASGIPSSACSTGRRDQRSRIAGRRLGAPGVRWMMTRAAASRSAGRPWNRTSSAPIPPADPTTATTWIGGRSVV